MFSAKPLSIKTLLSSAACLYSATSTLKLTNVGDEQICLSKSLVLNPCKFLSNLLLIVTCENGVKFFLQR